MDVEDLKLSRYIVTTEYNKEMIIFSTKSGKIIKVSNAVWEYLKSGNISGLPIEIQEYLKNNQILVNIDLDEFIAVLHQNEIVSNSDKVLYEVIQPTAYCQMGCFYCGQNHQNIQLDEDKISGIITRIEEKIQTNKFQALRIGWFGAEPLVGIASMVEITSRLKKICEQNYIGYSAKVVTNGLKLTESIFNELCSKLFVDFIEITIDGTEAFHNKRRNLKNSDKGTFNTIIRNVERAVKLKSENNYNVAISIRCNVDEENQNTVIPLINFLKKNEILHYVNFYTAKIHEWGDKSNNDVMGFDYPTEEISWLKKLIANNKTVSLLPKRVYNVCLATKKNSFVYDAYGNAFKCTEIPYINNDTQSQFFLGKINKDKVNDLDFAEIWISDIKAEKSYCLKCNFFPVCGGACPKSWLDGNIPCPSFKFNMPERLKLYCEIIRN